MLCEIIHRISLIRLNKGYQRRSSPYRCFMSLPKLTAVCFSVFMEKHYGKQSYTRNSLLEPNCRISAHRDRIVPPRIFYKNESTRTSYNLGFGTQNFYWVGFFQSEENIWRQEAQSENLSTKIYFIFFLFGDRDMSKSEADM